MNQRASMLQPHSTEAEMSVLGSMMLDSEALGKVIEQLRVDDFYHPAHRVLCEVIYSLHERNIAVDLLTVQEELRRRGQLDEVGGLLALVNIIESVPTAANAEYYARIVQEQATRRHLLRAAHEIIRLVEEPDKELQQILDEAEQCVYEVAERQIGREFLAIRDLTVHVLTQFDERQQQMQERSGGEPLLGVSTGYRDLNRILSGLQPSELIILAARPSVGKTSLAINIAEHVAIRERKPVAIFSLEMAAEQLVQRMLCSQAGVSAQRLRRLQLGLDEWVKLHEAAERLFDTPIHIDDSSNLSPMEMRAKCRRLKAKLQERELGLIVVDYLQLMRSSSRRTENRNQEIGEIARALKQIAREFKVPVLVLSQLSRSVERRENKRPMLSDLRDSGSIEAEADVVLFIHREEYYGDKDAIPVEPPPGYVRQEEVEIIVAKHRNGPTGKVTLAFQPDFSRFVGIEREHVDVY
ncbi:MAG: replicative DNA helicase [Fimbriimonadales bacterium]|nr:MAG: replicative DNA helicase [Fimbriimonadales bacterium]